MVFSSLSGKAGEAGGVGVSVAGQAAGRRAGGRCVDAGWWAAIEAGLS